ncbi:ATP-dependent zinc protease [Dermacoccaceae bacterium W4C1]
MPISPPSKPAPPTRTVAGWREWVSLPDLGVEWIKAKLDTGARTSALHAVDLIEFERDDIPWVRFGVHPWQDGDHDPIPVELPIHDRREVRSSSGHAEDRIVVLTSISLAGQQVQAEVTLSGREEMGFRMLVGREALRGAFVVDPARSYLGGRPPGAARRKNRGR